MSEVKTKLEKEDETGLNIPYSILGNDTLIIKKKYKYIKEFLDQIPIKQPCSLDEIPTKQPSQPFSGGSIFAQQAQIAALLKQVYQPGSLPEYKQYLFEEEYELIKPLTKPNKPPFVPGKEPFIKEPFFLSKEITLFQKLNRAPNHANNARLIGGDISGLVEALMEFSSFAQCPANMPEFLQGFRKQSEEDAILSHYSLQRDYGCGSSSRFYSRWYDAPYTFVLCYDLSPVASISFEAQQGAILVNQIQGVEGQQDKLKPIKWERGLLAYVCDWAAEHGVPEVRVLPHYKNKWERVKKNGKMLYDVTAKRSGFKFDEQMEVYRKPITPKTPLRNNPSDYANPIVLPSLLPSLNVGEKLFQ